jgi:hypothetical protein
VATPITVFEVPPDADAEFVAAWQAADAVLYRALRADVDFRFVAIGAPPPALGAFPAHAAVYDVVREHGTPDIAGGVVMIAPVELAAADDERFLADWDDARGVLAGLQGHLGARLYRVAGAARFRHVGLERWSSPLMVARAQRRPELVLPSHAALYQPVVG